MVTSDGYVKILDFGLAKLLPQPGADSAAATITKEGTVAGAVMGTASYMSPEQARGKSLDARTDVFSFGSVLCEMATGRRAFKGETHATLFDEILNKTPPLPSSLNPDTPSALDLLVRKSLDKKPDLRYPSAKELLAELKAIQAGPTSLQSKSDKTIVVLPFENISPDPEQEYFCDGITEEIISDLSLVEPLRVISRSSAMTFKGAQKKIREIADEVNVRYVLEGSVRKAGNNVRVTAQLIDASDDTHLWAEKYSGTLEDIFDIQEKVSRSIVDALKVVLAPEKERELAARPLDNAQAYDCYLRARQEIARWTEPGLDRAVQQLEMALRMVGDHAVLLAGLGYAYSIYYWGAFRMDEETLQKADDYARRAVQLDAEVAQGHFVLGTVALAQRQMQAAFRHWRKALSLSPDDPDTMFWLVQAAGWVGKPAVSRPLVARLLEIDPLAPTTYVASVIHHIYEGQFEAALEPGRTAVRLDPEGNLARFHYFLACVYNDRVEEFEPVLERWQRKDPEHTWTEFPAAIIAAQQGKEVAISDSTRDVAWQDVSAAGHGMPMIFSMLGRNEEALKWLERGVELGFINYPFLSHIDPRFENLRRDPRSRDIMDRIKQAWEQFEV
jgi:non-specific serine/threonine protein kinase